MVARFSMPRVVGRGAGLGNELIPWARAFLAAQVVGAKVLPPAFGLNQRRYWRHFGTPRYDWILHNAMERCLPVVEFTEEDYIQYGGGDFIAAFRKFAETNELHARSSYMLVTEGMWGGYRHIASARDFVFTTLYKSRFAAGNLLRISERLDSKKLTVGMHVRLGDFEAPVSQDEIAIYQGKFNLALPLTWYRNIAQSIMKSLGNNVQFLVVSDGSPQQLKPLLSGLDAVTTFDIPDSDCSDLLALARVDLLVCSVSSFSTTAAFLSHAPYLWFEPNLQCHDGEFYSIWGHEPAQQKIGSPTRAALKRKAFHHSHILGRGMPIGGSGKVPDNLLQTLYKNKMQHAADNDLVQYGVVRMEVR